MSIESIFNQFSHVDIDGAFIARIREMFPDLTKTDKKFIDKIITNPQHYDVNDVIKAIKLFLVFSNVGDGYELRKKGLFSYSKDTSFRTEIPQVIQQVLDFNTVCILDKVFIEFLQKKYELRFLAEVYSKIEKNIEQTIRCHHEKRRRKETDFGRIESSLLKELLVFIDYLFLTNTQCNDVYLKKDSIKDYSKEDICLAVSNLINLYDKYIGIRQDVHYYADVDYVLSNEFNNLVLTACKLDNLRELESFIDYYGYDVQINDNVISISGESDNIEKSIRLGYLKKQLAQTKNVFRIINNDNDRELIDFSEFMNQVIRNYPNLLKKVKDNGLPRYRLELPTNLFYDIERTMPKIGAFQDEYINLSIESHDLLIPQILDKKITEHCILRDVIKLQRFFCLVNEIYKKCLLNKYDKKKILASLTPTISYERFVMLFENILGDISKARELIKLFSYSPEMVLDLQYSPFIKSSNGISYSNAVTSQSNLIRNSIRQATRSGLQTVNMPEEKDVLTLECNNALIVAGFKTITEKKFSYNNSNSDIDVMAVSDTSIFIFECKCPINPTSNTELRTTFDYVRKAKSQLDLISLAMNDPVWAKKFLESNGLKYISTRKVYTCVVLGNRMFGGYNKYRHPIRNIFELVNVLISGNVQIGENKIRIWDKDTFSEDDLIRFLSETDNYHIKDMMKRLIPIKQTMLLDKYKVEYNTYCLDGRELLVAPKYIK